MTGSELQIGTIALSPIQALGARVEDRRRHQRVDVHLLGRYMLSDRQEYPCQVTNMSPGGVAMLTPVKGSQNERVVCYIDHVGRVEGVIARLFSNGFALQINVPLSKREKLAEQLTWLANRNMLGLPEDRRHERLAPRIAHTAIMYDGHTFAAKILDVSLSGAALQCDIRPSIGAPVTVGQTPARVVRVSGAGIAVEFLRLLAEDRFDDTLVL